MDKAEQIQRDVAAAGHRVQEHHGGGADGEDRDGQGVRAVLDTAAEPTVVGLTGARA
jgi:hypothetical protein